MNVYVPHTIADNRFLAALPSPTQARLWPHLTPIVLERRQRLFAPGEAPTSVYFMTRGLVSLVKSMDDGRVAEVGAIGAEGAVCLSGLLGLKATLLEALVQVHEIAAREPALAALMRDYAGVAIAAIAQTAACNRLHGLTERCCRWLLTAHDSVGGDSFGLTHELLALMLGVQRSGVSLAANALQRAGLIRYRNGQVTVLDRAGLEGGACECYGAMQARLDAVFGAA
jgi:CRP-like cAMP-binding protein